MAWKFVGGGKEKSLERPGLGHEIADQRRVACREKEIARRHELAGLQIASDVKNRFAFAHREGLLINLPADDFPENVASRHAMVEEIFARPQRASGMTPRIDLERQLAAKDRKSTRLNSSHGYISYAVFCLKKKKKKITKMF